MIIDFNKKQITSQFFNPISRISEECSLTVTPDSFSTLVNDNTDSIILYAKLKASTGMTGDPVNLNFKDLKKMSKIIDCIPDEEFGLKVNDSASIINYKSDALSFKLHLVADNVIKKCSASLDKISKLTFDSEFNLTCATIGDILKGSIFAADTDKIYFYTKDSAVYAELTDKSIQETDSITFNIASGYSGNDITTPLPFNLEILRIIAATKFDTAKVKINDTYKILLFEISTPEVLFKYIIPGYTK
jgi:hypothetical protein